jgi:uncharacterized protein YqeY
MTLQEKISKDITVAMKAGDKLRTETLRLLRASIIELNKRGLNREITPEEELSVLVSASKKRKEAIEEFTKAGRLEMAQKEEDELKIIQEYLPAQLSEEEITEKLKNIISTIGASGAKDFGKVMPVAMQELKGKADGKLIQTILKKLLDN